MESLEREKELRQTIIPMAEVHQLELRNAALSNGMAVPTTADGAPPERSAESKPVLHINGDDHTEEGRAHDNVADEAISDDRRKAVAIEERGQALDVEHEVMHRHEDGDDDGVGKSARRS